MEVQKITNNNFKSEVLESRQKVLIDFYANWCGPCKMMGPKVEEIAQKHNEIKVVKINVDEAEEIAMQYQIMSIPTLVVIENGQEINRSFGLISEEKIEELITK